MSIEFILDQLWWINKIAGGVWLILSAILIWVLVQLYRNEGTKNKNFRIGFALLIFVWLYPLYTGFFSSMILGELGNIATLLFTLYFLTRLQKTNNRLARLMLAQSCWLSIATIYLGLQLINAT